MSYNEAHARAVRKHQRAHRDRTKARRAVQEALKAGRISRTPCVRCGAIDGFHGHHEDYSRPLDVTWLCGPCHVAVHNIKRGTVARPRRLARLKNRLLELCHERGLTARTLATLAGLSPQHVESIERGETVPGLETARKLARVLGVTLDEAFPTELDKAANE